MSLVPLGQSLPHVRGLKTLPSGQVTDGQTQEQLVLLNSLGLGHGVGLHLALAPSPSPSPLALATGTSSCCAVSIRIISRSFMLANGRRGSLPVAE